MRDNPRLVVLAWGVVILVAVVILALRRAPLPVVLALIACLPRVAPDGDAPNSSPGSQPS